MPSSKTTKIGFVVVPSVTILDMVAGVGKERAIEYVLPSATMLEVCIPGEGTSPGVKESVIGTVLAPETMFVG